jgi:hypothetical protein
MSDYSIYPDAIDGYAQLPLLVDRVTSVNSEGINRLRSAILNMENALGVSPHKSDIYGDFKSTSDRLSDLDFTVSSLCDPTLGSAYLSGREITASLGAVSILGSEYLLFKTEGDIKVGAISLGGSGELELSAEDSLSILSDSVSVRTNSSGPGFSIQSNSDSTNPIIELSNPESAASIFVGVAKPDSSPGLFAPLGSVIILASGEAWIKEGSSNLEWRQIATIATQIEVDLGTPGKAVTGETLYGSNMASDVAANNAKVTNQNHTGDVTGDSALVISPNVVSNSRLSEMPGETIKGNLSVSSSDPQDLTSEDVTSLIETFTSTLKGSVPASGGGSLPTLRADGTWSAVRLSEALAAGSSTSGEDIVLTTGDEITAQTDMIIRADSAGSKIELRPSASEAVSIIGKLATTDQASFPSVVLTESATPSTGASEGSIFVSDGANEVKGQVYYREENNGTLFSVQNPPNQVLIAKLSDFPAPIAGVITLDGGTIYRVSGAINLGTNRIESTGAIIITGGNLAVDSITTSNASALFSHTNTSTVQVSELALINSGGDVFDIDGGGLSNIIITRCLIVASVGFGTLSNSLQVSISRSAIASCGSGIRIVNSHSIVSVTDCGFSSGTGSFTAMVFGPTASIGSMRIRDCNISLAPGHTGIDISPSASIISPPARFDDVVFTGNGSNLSGITKANPNYEFFQCIGILNSITFGSVGFSSPVPIIVNTSGSVGVYVDIATSPASPVYSQSPVSERAFLSNPNNGEITYSGIKPITAIITASISSAGSGGATRPTAMAAFLDSGSGYNICPNSEFFASAHSSPSITSAKCIVFLNPGAKVKFMVKQVSGGPINILANTTRIDVESVSL